jgi:uncharacterized protein YceK
MRYFIVLFMVTIVGCTSVIIHKSVDEGGIKVDSEVVDEGTDNVEQN